ncbi:MAG: TonB-dependent receptor [Pseudomonadota bacterium]
MQQPMLISLRVLALLAVLLPPIAAAAAADGTDTPLQIEEIIVRGEKIERSLQDTAASVAVYEESTIVEQNFVDLNDLLNQTANVAPVFDGRGFTIRGVRNTGVSPGDQTSDVSTVYVDGVFIPSSVFSFTGLNLWDTSSVEVFRGPQSTLQGRNALAGAIVSRTVDPGNEFEGRVQLRVADYDSLRTSAAVSVPILEDQLALRLAADRIESDGFTDNPVRNTDDGDASENTTLRGKLLFTPNAIPELTARLSLSYFDIEQGENRLEEDLFPDRVSRQNIEDRQTQEVLIGSLELVYDLTERLSLTSVTSLQETDTEFSFDTSNDEGGGDIPGFTVSDDEVFSQELRLTYQGDRFTGIVGAYLFESESSFDNETSFSVESAFAFPDPATLAGLLFSTPAPDATQVAQADFIRSQIVALIPNFDVAFQRAATDEITNYAIFGEGSYDLTDRLTLTLGARFDVEDVEQTAFDATIVPPLPQSGDPTIDAIVAGVAAQFTNSVDLVADNDFNAFLPKAVLRYDWTDDLSVSASVQRAYRAGGLSFNVFRAALPIPDGGDPNDQSVLESAGVINSFDPEFTWNYELAVRSQWFGRRLTLNGNLFYIEYEDQQINVQLSANPLDTLTDNVGASELLGFELEANAVLADGLTVFANLGFSDTEFTEAVNTIGETNLEGLEFSVAPRWTAGAGGRYTHSSGFFGNVRTRYTDESFSNVNNDPSGTNDSFFIVDVLVGYQSDRYTIELFANNLFDEDYLTGDFVDPSPGAVAYAGNPRVVGARFVADF